MVIAAVLNDLDQAIFTGVFITVLVLLARLLLRRTWAAVVLVTIILVVMNTLTSSSPIWDGFVLTAILGVVMVALLQYGLLTLIGTTFVLTLLQTCPSSLSMSSWYAYTTTIPLLVVLALAIAAFAVSLGKQQWFELSD
jgi:hypothetical protein